jgi:thiamine-phosphate pyrophosphorylase
MRSGFRLPIVYPLTDVSISGLSHAQQVHELIGGGAGIVQLREKHLAPKEFCAQAIEALKIARQHNVPLIINDRLDIALAIGADGVHLGQDDLPVEAARRILGDEAIIGYSTHNSDQVEMAMQLPVDYIAIGPIFQTSSKEKPDPVVGLEGLRKIRTLVGNRQLVAIGGITHANARETIEAGADCVAIISAALVSPTNISTNIASLLQVCVSAVD